MAVRNTWERGSNRATRSKDKIDKPVSTTGCTEALVASETRSVLEHWHQTPRTGDSRSQVGTFHRLVSF